METNLLLNMLGIIIGFMGAMMVLSMLVTIINQLILNLLGSRSKSLKRALGGLLNSALLVRHVNEDAVDTRSESGNQTGSGTVDAKTLLDRDHHHRGVRALAHTCTSIELDELEDLLEEQNLLQGEYDIEKIRKRFSRMERAASQQFQVHANAVALIISIALAFLLQVSTPDLLMRLSTDEAFRTQAEAAALRSVEQYEKKASAIVRFEDLSAEVLSDLQVKYAHIPELEEVTGIGDTREDILAEMRLVLRDVADSTVVEEIMAAYGSQLDLAYDEANAKLVELVDEEMATLALLNITPWKDGWPYYYKVEEGQNLLWAVQWANLLGVFITALLISLGAPFWYNQLQKAASLRDFLKK